MKKGGYIYPILYQIELKSQSNLNITIDLCSSGLPGVQMAAASYGVPNQSAAAAAAVTAATAGQLAAPSQAALAAQGLAAQQPTAAAAAAGVVHVPYPPGAAATAAVQQFQMNGQPTTLAL